MKKNFSNLSDLKKFIFFKGESQMKSQFSQDIFSLSDSDKNTIEKTIKPITSTNLNSLNERSFIKTLIKISSLEKILDEDCLSPSILEFSLKQRKKYVFFLQIANI